jgi:hypothetical protein
MNTPMNDAGAKAAPAAVGTSATAKESRGVLGKITDTLVGVYGLGVIGVALAMHSVGWLTAIGDGIIWPFTLYLFLSGRL